MKKLKLTKVIASTLVIASVLALNPIGASAEWESDPRGWWYTEGNSWATGWRLINSKWYYFDSKGYMAKDTTIDGYYVNDSGARAEITISGDFKFDKSTGTIVEYIGSDSSVVIPNKIDGTDIKRIRFTSASSCKNLTSITIPDSTTGIESIVCMNCSNLTHVDIPNSVKRIGAFAFNGCTNLKSIAIPDSVKIINEAAFRGCKSLNSIIIPNSVQSIGPKAFAGCSGLTTLTIPNSVTNIGDGIFQNCINLTNITIPDSVKTIGYGAFSGCSSLSNIKMPNGITIINEIEFQGCSSLSSIVIPNGVTSIQKEAFEGCTNLTSITIPDSVTSIANYVNSPSGGIGINPFQDCTKATIYVKSEKTKQLLINSGVSASKIIVSA
ncbi:leucine-rich repeat protein [Clostridium sp. YIM B02555]|uniref:leucine-rich repeat protein n=1 Tax=Clostridium sp. YIM B02555 TaxID=2911968 RepID=UPI001EEECEFB|nr:leucine-rich repeat protein [Clostridium sp. YIM B02555]